MKPVPVGRTSFSRSIGLAVILTFLPAPLLAQVASAQSPGQPPSQIVTSATGEATLVPDRGIITFAVEERAQTAAAAGAQNARLQAAVIAAIRAKGVAPEHITTSGYSVGPDEQYPKGERKVVGYIARNAVVVDVQKLDQVGALIDAALGAGANSIGGLRYYSTNLEAVRRSALERAVSKARSDAEVMARAAGGSLGAPLEIMANDMGMPRPIGQFMVTGRAMSADVETPVSVGEQKVTVSVTTRWIFVPTR